LPHGQNLSFFPLGEFVPFFPAAAPPLEQGIPFRRLGSGKNLLFLREFPFREATLHGKPFFFPDGFPASSRVLCFNRSLTAPKKLILTYSKQLFPASLGTDRFWPSTLPLLNPLVNSVKVTPVKKPLRAKPGPRRVGFFRRFLSTPRWTVFELDFGFSPPSFRLTTVRLAPPNDSSHVLSPPEV